MIRDCVCKRSRHVHGTVRAYQGDKCRCFPCRIAYAAHRSSFTLQRDGDDDMWQPRIGVRRRLQALHVEGWTDRRIGERMGLSPQAVYQLRTNRSDRILRSTAARVETVYNQLWDETPPQDNATLRARINAAKQGWAPPMAWDDDTVDDPTAMPQHRLVGPRFKHGDVVARAQHVAVLTRAGLTAREIADRLGTTPRNVSRDRARTREAAA